MNETELERIRAIQDDDEREKALDALEASLEASLDVLEASLPPRLTPAEYAEALAKLDVTSAADLRDFIASSALTPDQPVPVGTHAGVRYFLVPSADSMPRSVDPAETVLDKSLPRMDNIVAYRRAPLSGAKMPGTPSIKFGFGLGRLMCLLPTAEEGEYKDQGFWVVCSALDKSVWITFDCYPNADMADWSEFEGIGGGALDGTDVQIGTMRVSSLGWHKSSDLTLDGGDILTGAEIWGSRLEASSATVKSFQMALEDAKKRGSL